MFRHWMVACLREEAGSYDAVLGLMKYRSLSIYYFKTILKSTDPNCLAYVPIHYVSGVPDFSRKFQPMIRCISLLCDNVANR
jgi:hypothetical protein